MKNLNIALIWTNWDFQNTLIFNLIKKISKQKIVITPPHKADFIIYGSYNWGDPFKTFNIYELLKKKFFRSKKIVDFIYKCEMKLVNRNIFNRNYKPLTLHYITEFHRNDTLKTDFVISQDLGVQSENHLYDGNWKESCDWSSEGIIRPMTQYPLRIGKFINIDDLTIPQGDEFLKKNKKICIITSHLYEPRKTFYDAFSKHFTVDGYGGWFEKNINPSVFEDYNKVTKLEIMKNYAFNLCPENSIYPGYTSDRIPTAFIGKCLPITWADQNINYEFNPKAFVNLNDHFQDNFVSIINNLKDDNFLRQFTKEPLLLKRPNLEKEIKFVEKILSCF
jgi:hypothetical protein